MKRKSFYTGIASRKGTAALARLGCRVRFESSIEEACLYLLDYDHDVLSVVRSPSVPYLDADHKFRSYTADFTVGRKGSTVEAPSAHDPNSALPGGSLDQRVQETLECKPVSFLATQGIDEEVLWKARAQALQVLGMPLRFVTDEEVFSAKHTHARAFGPYFAVVPDPLLASAVLAAADEEPAPIKLVVERACARLREPPNDRRRGFPASSQAGSGESELTQRVMDRLESYVHAAAAHLIARRVLVADESVEPTHPSCVVRRSSTLAAWRGGERTHEQRNAARPESSFRIR